MKLYAARLAWREAVKYARISSHDCFCCACVDMVREHRSHLKWTGTEKPRFTNLLTAEGEPR